MGKIINEASDKFANIRDNNKGLMRNGLLTRSNNMRLTYTNFQDIISSFCCLCIKTNEIRHKNCQYEKCIEEVSNYTNLNFIIRKIKEIDYIKALLFKREQILSFNFFHKPLVKSDGGITESYSRTINEIHNDITSIDKEKQVDLISSYFDAISETNKYDKFDKKILNLIDIDFV